MRELIFRLKCHCKFDSFRTVRKENDLFKMISPVETLEKHVETIMQCYIFDKNDNSFIQNPNDAFKHWTLYAQRIPPTILHRELR